MQYGKPSNQPVRSVITRNTPAKNSPKKLKRKKKSRNIASTKVHNLPAKAKKTTLKPKTPKKCDGKMLRVQRHMAIKRRRNI